MDELYTVKVRSHQRLGFWSRTSFALFPLQPLASSYRIARSRIIQLVYDSNGQ